MSVDLVLGAFGAESPLAGGAVYLILGETEGSSGTLTDATLAATLRVVAAASVAVAVAVGGARAVAPWGAAGKAPHRGAGLPWGVYTGAVFPRGTSMPWDGFLGTKPGAAGALTWGVADKRTGGAAAPWGVAIGRATDHLLPWGRSDQRTGSRTTPWGAATKRTTGARAPWGLPTPRPAVRTLPWGRAGLLPAVNRPLPAAPGVWGFTPAATGPVNLHFCVYAADDSLDLVLGGEVCITQPRIPDGTAIAARRTYMQAHSLTAYRLPDMTPVPLTSFDLAADEGSFGWTLSAAGPLELLSLLAPSGGLPAQLRVTLDGLTWEFIVEGLRRERAFGRTTASITGRSAAALLGDPYSAETAYLNAVPATAQQIINEALQYTDLTLDWQCTDWLVPAGAWSFTGTPLAVVRRVAESIGAIVQCPRTGDVIRVQPRYPVLPWNWTAASPDVTLALDPITSEGYERADKPAYEGVYVSGQAQGVLALVKRTGTGPDLLLPTVTDALITHLDAARQRGEAMLGAAGPQAVMTQVLPVLTGSGEPGVIDVGKLVLVDDPAGAWKGRVRSVSVRADRLSVRQTISLERHL